MDKIWIENWCRKTRFAIKHLPFFDFSRLKIKTESIGHKFALTRSLWRLNQKIFLGLQNEMVALPFVFHTLPRNWVCVMTTLQGCLAQEPAASKQTNKQILKFCCHKVVNFLSSNRSRPWHYKAKKPMRAKYVTTMMSVRKIISRRLWTASAAFKKQQKYISHIYCLSATCVFGFFGLCSIYGRLSLWNTFLRLELFDTTLVFPRWCCGQTGTLCHPMYILCNTNLVIW